MSTRYTQYRRIGNVARFVLLALALIVFLFPLYWMFRTSILPTNTIYSSANLIPSEFTLVHYQRAIEVGFLDAIINSLIVAIGTTLLTTVVSLLGAYSILRYTYPGRQKAARMILITYMFPHVALIVPMYQLVASLGLLNNFVMLMVVHTMLALPFCIWILQSFLEDIPRELEEAAMVEGASEFGAFARITVPQAMPGIIAAGTFAYIISWGEFLFSYILMTDSSAYTVPVELQQLLGSYSVNWGLLTAVSVLATLPVLAIFWLMVKYLGEGIAKGSGAT